jgi:hypothetical protein
MVFTGDEFRLQFGQRLAQMREIGGVGKNDKVSVARFDGPSLFSGCGILKKRFISRRDYINQPGVGARVAGRKHLRRVNGLK